MASHYYKWHHGRIHYQRKGMGDPLVLIHNIHPGASLEEWERNIDPLSRQFTTYAIDLLGFGDSDAPNIKYKAATYVELIFDFLREVVGKPALVLSSGLSCAYVSEVAAWRANLFSRLCFICPRSEPVGMDSPRWVAAVRRFLMSSPTLGSGFYETMAGEAELEVYLRQCFWNPRAVTREKIQRLVENSQRKGSIHPYASLITGYLDSSILKWLPKVEVPLLLIWGKQARPTPVEHSVRLVAIARQCRLEVVDDAGSWVHDEQSARVNQLIIDYADSQLPPMPKLPPKK
ncbi:MAG: alpha/beta fold hydrolase [Tepidisphaeraceae bacterium]|jgi:pimeloyl-ACP methyl ester carboxylesterase